MKMMIITFLDQNKYEEGRALIKFSPPIAIAIIIAITIAMQNINSNSDRKINSNRNSNKKIVTLIATSIGIELAKILAITMTTLTQ